jgi:histidine triad (HIT) family protein
MITITPEIKAQLDEQKKQCVFCKIINGEMETNKVYEDKIMFGTLDINPAIEGHMLMMPKEHYPILPYVQQKDFEHIFGNLPKIVNALKKAMLATGATVFIANGGVAGQQSPHFLIHLLPREKGDKHYLYLFDKKKKLDAEKAKQTTDMLVQGLPGFIHSDLKTKPIQAKTAEFLSGIKSEQKVLYEDDKVLCVIYGHAQCIGHIAIYSQKEEHLFEKLDNDSAAHIFRIASLCSSAVFNAMKSQGTNIILKTGISDDNPDGRLCIHIIPRFENDELKLMWEPGKKGDLKKIASKLKDEMSYVEYELKEKKETKPKYDLDKAERMVKLSSKEEHKPAHEPEELDEIKKAINRLRNA